MATQVTDLYAVLGVSETATADEIKKAYRKLAKKHHPDATGGDKASEAKFKEVTAANEVLSDPKKRTEYDKMRKNPFHGQGGGPGGGGFRGGAVDLEELLRNMGQGGGGGGDSPFDMFGGMFGGEQRRGPRRGQDISAELDVELPDAALGAERVITVDGKRLNVKIPAGVQSGQTIRLAGQGRAGARGAPPGDLHLQLNEKPHALFRRRAAASGSSNSVDIDVDVQVPLDIAILGGKVDVPTLEGTLITMSIPAGTSSGKKLRLKGKGAAHGGSSSDKLERGDLYANVLVQVPATLDAKQQQLLNDFATSLRK